MSRKIRELRADNVAFIENIHSYIDRLKVLMNKPELSFSYEEIDRVQQFYETHYRSPERIGISYDELEQIFYAYAGQSFIHHHGGDWGLSTLKNDDAYGTPIIVNWGPQNYPWSRLSPHVWKILIERGTFKGNLSEAIK